MSGASTGADAVDRSRRAALVDTLRRIPAFARDDVTDVVRMGGMTNRTYRVRVGGRRVIVRMPSPGRDPVVDRNHELTNTRLAATMGLAPDVEHADPACELLITTFVDGPVLTPAAVGDGDMLERIGALLGRVHRLDAGRFRGRFDVATVIGRYRTHLDAAGVPIGDDGPVLSRRALRLCAVLSSRGAVVPCHNDPWPSNIIETDRGLVLVDWEYSALGDPLWDLSHLTVEADLDTDQVDRLLRSWCDGAPPPQVRARLALWRPVIDVVWGLWALVQDAGGNDQTDLQEYAARRLRRARRLLADDRTADAERVLA